MTASQINDDTAMMLAAAATIGATARPSGETPQEQTTRIAIGITAQLDAIGGWTLRWLMMSPDNANLAYIAENQKAAQVAVAIRGTSGNIVDVMEDFDVGTTVPFPASGSKSTVWVSKGAMEAFTEIVNTSAPGGQNLLAGNLTSALTTVLGDFKTSPTVFVVGHSLGGCVATMVAPYLLAHSGWPNQPAFGILTFAAPTAGGQAFATYFDSLVGTSPTQLAQCTFTMNVYDLIPQAWATLDNVLHDPYNKKDPGALPWYPKGTVVTGELKDLILALEEFPGNNTYVQPGRPGTPTSNWINKNTDYGKWDPALTSNTLEDFMGQIGYQHANATYLALINPDAQLLAAPTVNAVTPNFGDGDMSVDIIGDGFTAVGGYPVAVDFGTTALSPDEFKVVNDTKITVNHVPPCAGIVDVRVTNALGTSAATPGSQFAYGGPEPVRVAGIAPNTGRFGDYVSVYGLGFTAGADVFFGRNQSPEVTVLIPAPPDPPGPPYLYVKVPADQAIGTKTVDVTVAVNGYSSPHSPADEFTYPGAGAGG